MSESPQDAQQRVNDLKYIVLIGAADGGASARKLLRALPDLPGAAVVCVHDGSSDRLAALSQDIGGRAMVVDEQVAIEAGRIYLSLPDQSLGLKANRGVMSCVPVPDRRALDQLFQQGAASGLNTIGILLAGEGSCGTAGFSILHQQGGLTIVQSPESSNPDELPLNAIRLGQVDCVAAIEDMPEILTAYIQHHQVVCHDPTAHSRDHEPFLQSLLEVLQHKTGVDLRNYRPAVLDRRIQRRIGYTRSGTWASYLELVRSDAGEAETLARDLLINVTQFFRDPAAWVYLQEHGIPDLIEQLPPATPIRAWVPACASGEEAYSLAIAISECITNFNCDASFQIFATDLRPESLERARAGTYPLSIAADVSGERLDRFFTREGNVYRIKKSIRERIIFSSHDVLSDPPFGNLDLVSCRNLLIYLRPEGQRRLLSLLRYGLRDNGLLFLGKAESIGQFAASFTVVSKKWRIYRHRRGSGAPEVPSANARYTVTRAAFPLPTTQTPEDVLRKGLLDLYAPACVIVDDQLQIQYLHGQVSSFLRPESGPPTKDLGRLVPAAVRNRLWSAIRKAGELQAGVQLSNVMLGGNGERVATDIHVQPLAGAGAREVNYILAFQKPPHSDAAEVMSGIEADSSLYQELEQELQLTRAQLQGTIYELERSNEALRASNEEIMSMNEELQSANEELETSREELQSLNEELRSVNLLLEEKVRIAEESRDDVENLLGSINIPTIFLDANLRIKRFTPATTSLLSLIDSDVGRTVSDFAHKFAESTFPEEAAEALRLGVPSEKPIQTTDGRIFMRYIHPYVTGEGAIEGLVVTFWDITVLRQTQEALRLNEERFRTALRESPIVVYQQDSDLRYTWVYNAQASFSVTDIVGRTTAEVYEDPDTVERLNAIKRRILATGKGERLETHIVVGKRVHHFDLVIEPTKDDQGNVTGIIAAAADITDRVNGERDRRRLASIVETSTDAILAKTLDGVVTNWNKGAEILYGYTSEEMLGRSIATLAPPGYEHEIAQLLKAIRAGKRVDPIETVRSRKDGSLVHVSLTVSPIVDGSGKVIGASVIARDITARKAAEKQLLELNETLERRIAERTRSMVQYQEQLRTLASQLTLAEQQERRRLSTELHDYLAQQLVVCQMHLARVLKALGTERARDLISEIDEMLAKCLQYTRTLVAELSPSVLFEMGLSAAIQWLGSQMETHGLQVHVVESCPEPDFSDDEAILLFKTIRELLFNVVKHARCTDATVTLASNAQKEYVVTVQDRGAGFDPSALGRQPTGAGKYGLFSLRERLDVLGGRFEIESAPGHGTCVTLVVPYRPKNAPVPPSGAEVHRQFQEFPNEGADAEKKLRIIIADDHRLVRQGIRNLFGGYDGIEVVAEAENGEQALLLAREFLPEVLVMDVNMPRMNGIEATRLLKKEMPDIAVVGLSVYDDKEIAASMLEAGASCYVTKGSPADELYAAVQAAASRGQQSSLDDRP